MQKKRLAIVTTHPIQYNAPLFRLMAQRGVIEPKVFYTWSQARESVEDKDFRQTIVWDIPLLDGYEYEFIENISTKPKQTFGGLVNPGLIRAIERFNPDAVLVFGWNYSSHFKTMRHFHGRVPVWFRGDSMLLDETPGLKTILRHIALKYVYRYIDKAFYVGQNNKDYFLAFGLKENELTFAPHAIDNGRFGSAEAEKRGLEWRRELGFTDDEIVIVFAGKISRIKNICSFAEQFAHYADANPETKLRFLIVGNGELEADVSTHRYISRLPFQNQSRMPALNHLGDIYALPSICSETWGLAINEAMAAGRAVIVSPKVGCARDLVKDGENGFYFSLTDRKENQELFKKIENADLKEIGEINRRAIKSWSHEDIARIIEESL